MKIAILCQEEPVFLAAFIQGVIRQRPDGITAVIVAGARSAGEKSGSMLERLRALRIFWLLFEPRGFLEAAWRRARSGILGIRGPDSIEACARAHGIRVRRVQGRRAYEVKAALEDLDADVVLNQSEILLGADVLGIPRIGFVNRHGSLLPAHRGRLGSFRAHAADPPSYGVTIHMVDEGIDTGDVLVRWEAEDVDPCWPFPRVLRHLNERAPALFWSAMDGLARGQRPTPQRERGGSAPRRFPTLEEARTYRTLLSARRAAARRVDSASDRPGP